MPNAELAPLPIYRFLDDNGDPLVGGKLYTYESGTTTPKATYKDVAAAEANTNPIILNARGEATVRIVSGSYTFKLTDADDVDIWTVNNVQSLADLISTTGALAVNNNLSDLDDNDTAITNLETGATGGDLVQTTRTQTLTNKTIDADNNTISNLAHGAEVDSPSSGVHGVTGSVVGTSDTQTLTNKTISASNNTISDIANTNISASAAIAVSKLAALTTGRAVTTNGSGILTTVATTDTELTYLNGVTSAVQTQLNGKLGLSVATTKGDIFAATASATVARLGAGADGTFLRANSATATGLEWGSVSSNVSISSISTGTTASTHDVYLCDASGGAFTLTLPAAASNTGKVYTIKKTDSSTNAVTIDGNASETIDGATTTTLNTQAETLKIVCDGTNWEILERRIRSVWVSFTPTGDFTNTTYDGRWRRVGDSMEIEYYGILTGTPAAANLTVNLPSGYTADESKIALSMGGSGAVRDSAPSARSYPVTLVYIESDNKIYFVHPESGNFGVGGNTQPFTWAVNDYFYGTITIPITDWNG